MAQPLDKHMDKTPSQEILSTLSLTEEETFEKIGSEISSGQDAFPPDKQELIRTGKRWWTHNRERLLTSVCSSEVIKNISESGDELALVVAVLDLISGIMTGISPATVAVLIVKLGLGKVCESMWNND